MILVPAENVHDTEAPSQSNTPYPTDCSQSKTFGGDGTWTDWNIIRCPECQAKITKEEDKSAKCAKCGWYAKKK